MEQNDLDGRAAPGVPLLSATALGMTYGCIVLLALNLLRRNAFIIVTEPR